MNKLKTKDIVNDLKVNHFVNWQHWTREEFKTWVKTYYECSNYIANKVSYYINEF